MNTIKYTLAKKKRIQLRIDSIVGAERPMILPGIKMHRNIILLLGWGNAKINSIVSNIKLWIC